MTRLAWRITLDAFRLAPLRRLAQVRASGGVDVLEGYRRIAEAAVALAAPYSGNTAERLSRILLGPREKP
jgi:hypothetical protein